MNSVKQAQIKGFSDGRFPVKNIGHDKVTVVAQHIALVRIDVQDGNRPERTVVNLFGTNDVDRLIAALQDAKARLVREQELLNQVLGRKCESAAASAA